MYESADSDQSRSGENAGVLSTLANGLAVLEALVGGGLSLREIADEVGLPRQTTYRLVHTLMVMGWVDRNASGDRYGLSPRLWSLGVRSFKLTDLRDVLAPAVRALAADFGETVHLAIYDRGSTVYIDKRDGSLPIRSYTELGGRAPAYCVATGKVLLAHEGSREWEIVSSGGLNRFTELTITDPEELAAELTAVAAQGYAVNRGEWRAEVGGVAVPIVSPAGDVVAALGFSGPSDRILSQLDTLLEALREAARLGKARRQIELLDAPPQSGATVEPARKR